MPLARLLLLLSLGLPLASCAHSPPVPELRLVACDVAADLLHCAPKPDVAADDSPAALATAAIDFGTAWADCKKRLAEVANVLAECFKKVTHAQ